MDEFEKDRQKRLGERGNPIFERTTDTTDLDEMQERVKEQTGACYCGRPIVDETNIRRCVACDLICCRSCQVVVQRQIICQSCAEQAYGLDKEAFLTLYFLDKDLVSADQLIEVTTAEDGTPIELRIDAAAHLLFEHGYLADDESLTPRGREALQVGQQLYGEDNDVQQAIRNARIKEVADR